MSRQSDRHRPIRWLWTSRQWAARAARLVLLPASLCYWVVMRMREFCYASGFLPSKPLPLPSVSIGNLSVGGSGKTPLAGWVATYFATRGQRPGILLRGVGGDEVLEHRESVKNALVEPDPDRIRGAARALAAGAEVLVLDDAFQRLDTRRDLNICVVSAEASQAVQWPLPAGPWREGFGALRRADALVITRKRADLETASALAERLGPLVKGPVAIAHLEPTKLRGLLSGTEQPIDALRDRRVIAACAIADPAVFARQLKRAGALVQVESWADHHAFDDEDIAWLIHAVDRADFVVMTAKDAVKIRSRWPVTAREPLVAQLEVAFDSGEAALCDALDRIVRASRTTINPN